PLPSGGRRAPPRAARLLAAGGGLEGRAPRLPGARCPVAGVESDRFRRGVRSRAEACNAANKPADAFDELRKAAALHPRDARAQEDLAIALQWRQPTDETERMPLRAMERVMDVASTDPEAALRFARLEDRDANKRRAALETALA